MFLRRALWSGLLVGVTTCTTFGGGQAQTLQPRTPTPKTATHLLNRPVDLRPAKQQEVYPVKLVVKFRDEIKARAKVDGGLLSLSNVDLSPALALRDEFDLRFVKSVKMSDSKLAALEQRAASYSGKSQPDLAGTMIVQGPEADLEQVAKALNDLDIVEWVCWHGPFYLHGGGDADCGDCDDIGCGDCFTVTDGVPFCADMACCDLVCEIDPFCCDEFIGEWDAFCVGIANIQCDDGDICASPLGGGCIDEHPTPGCSDEDCCNIVCDLETFCCEVEWDELCVNLAVENCEFQDPGDTPNLSDLQGYLSSIAYNDYPGGPPAGLVPPVPDLEGWTGEGYDMPGLWQLGQDLLDIGVGSDNLTRGKGVRVAIIEFGAYINHEDLVNKLNVEPGQTVIEIPVITEPDHGTATLGIVGAEDNGSFGRGPDEVGCVGIAHEAELWFFPAVSVEEGGRLNDAIINCIDRFEPGDIISMSLGPGPAAATLAGTQDTFALMEFATSLGITVFISAGNDCFNLDDATNLGDSGCIIVGAGTPGRPHCRLGFSNHFEAGDGQVVHCQAWGERVATLGYGSLFAPGGDPNRSYTAVFNGTSAAAPMAAGLGACLQGFARQFYGIPMSPGTIRSVMSSGFPQCLILNPDDLPGAQDAFVCLGDFDFDEEPNEIGPFTNTVEAAASLVQQEQWFGDSIVEDIQVLRGSLQFGNVFSVLAIDNNLYAVATQMTNPTSPPNNPPFGARPRYYLTGQQTDVEVLAVAAIQNVTDVNVQFATNITEQIAPAFLLIEATNWSTKKCILVGAFLLPPGDVINPIDTLPIFNAGQFVSSENEIAVHFNHALLGGGLQPPTVVNHDFLDVIATSGFIVDDGGGLND